MKKIKTVSDRQFCLVVVVASLGVFALVAGLNWVVNPYAQYATNCIEPLVQTSRSEKVELLSQIERPPGGLIVGSSRVLKLEPEYLQSRFGHAFFNAGVNYGKPEDFLAFVRYYQSNFGKLPETLVVGLDVHGFNDRLPTDARLLSNQDLSRQVPDAIPFADRFHRFRELLSWQQTMSSLKSVKRVVKEDAIAEKDESFQSDGLIVYHRRRQEIRDGVYDFTAALEYNQREYKQLYVGYDSISKDRMEYFLRTVKMCREAGTRVYVFLTPLHPDLASYLTDSTTYDARRFELVQSLRRESSKLGLVFMDCSDVAKFGGRPGLFVDGIHPLEPNTRRMIDRLTAMSAEDGQLALQ